MEITLDFLEKDYARKISIQAWKDYGLEFIDVFECIEKLKSEQENIKKNYDGENSLKWAVRLLPYCMKLDDIIKYTDFCVGLAAEAAIVSMSKAISISMSLAAKAWERIEAALMAKTAIAEKMIVSEGASSWASRWAWMAVTESEIEEKTGDKTSLKIIDYGIKLLKESQMQADNKKEGE